MSCRRPISKRPLRAASDTTLSRTGAKLPLFRGASERRCFPTAGRDGPDTWPAKRSPEARTREDRADSRGKGLSENKGQHANPVLTLRSSHSKAASRLPGEGENAGDLIVSMVRVPKRFWTRTCPGSCSRAPRLLSRQGVKHALQADDERFVRDKLQRFVDPGAWPLSSSPVIMAGSGAK